MKAWLPVEHWSSPEEISSNHKCKTEINGRRSGMTSDGYIRQDSLTAELVSVGPTEGEYGVRNTLVLTTSECWKMTPLFLRLSISTIQRLEFPRAYQTITTCSSLSIHPCPICCTSRAAPVIMSVWIQWARWSLVWSSWSSWKQDLQRDATPWQPYKSSGRLWNSSSGQWIGGLYLWQIDIWNDNTVKSAGSIFGRVLWVTTWVVF